MTGNDSHTDGERLDDPRALLDSLAYVLSSIPVAVAVFDADLHLRHCNEVWRRWTDVRTGGTARIEPGVHLSDCVPDVDAVLEALGPVLSEGRIASYPSLPTETPDGVFYADITVAPMVEEGVMTGFVQIGVDATDRVRTHRELELLVDERTAELQRRREVAEGLHEILTILNSCCPTDQILDYIISQAKRLLSGDAVAVYSLSQGDGQGILTASSHGIPDDLLLDIVFPTHEGFVAGTIMQRQPLVCPDSSMLFGPITDRMQPEHRDRIHRIFTRYRALLAVPLVLDDEVWGAVGMYYLEPREFTPEDVALASDLADHLALAIENARLREDAEEAATTAERNRLARDLHDAVTQTLFSASLIAEVLPRIWERDQDEGLKRLEQLRHLTRGALAEMRTLLLELRPAALVEAELGEVLRQLAESKAAAGLAVDVFVEGSPRRLPADTQVALYRTAQEALNNIAKHSGASRAELSLRYLGENIELCVDDNGAGFDPDGVSGDHFGLRIMRERAEAIGGRFVVESTPGVGTCVSVILEDTTEKECGCPTPSE